MIDGLVEAAEHQFWLFSTLPDSDITRYAHFKQIEKQSEKPVPELQGGQIPEILYYIWEWFQELNAARGEGPISYQEIQAWANLTGRCPKQFEISALKALDLKFLEHHYNGG